MLISQTIMWISRPPSLKGFPAIMKANRLEGSISHLQTNKEEKTFFL